MVIIILITSCILFLKKGNDKIDWSDVILTKGLVEEEIKLTKEIKDQISALMYEDYMLEPYTEQNDKNYYGGNHYHIIFINDEIKHDWVLTDLQIEQTIYKEEKEVSKQIFNPNKSLINIIENICNN